MDQLLVLENYYQENFNLTHNKGVKKTIKMKVVNFTENDVESEYESSNDDIQNEDNQLDDPDTASTETAAPKYWISIFNLEHQREYEWCEYFYNKYGD